MHSYIKPIVYNIPNPVGVDRAIYQAQVQLAALLPWLQVIYGRAYRQLKKEINKNVRVGYDEHYFPETWGKNREVVNCMPNANVASQVFFVVRDPTESAEDVEPFANQIVMRSPVSVIFWANLQLINSGKVYRYTEELKKDILFALTRVPTFEFSGVIERFENVLDSFTITDTYKQYSKPPYVAFRIDGFLNYPMFGELGSCDIEDGVYIPSNIEEMITEIVQEYSVKSIVLAVGVDIAANPVDGEGVPIEPIGPVIIERSVLDLDENEILEIGKDNQRYDTPAVGVNSITNSLNFSAYGGIYSGNVWVLYRKKTN